MSSRRITKNDLRELAASNFMLAGRPLSEWKSDPLSVKKAVADHYQRHSSKDTLEVLRQAFWKNAQAPSYFLVNLPDACIDGSHIGAMITPFSLLRDELGQRSDDRFKSGYELPVVLLNSVMASEQGVRVEKAIGEIGTRISLFKIAGSERENAFSFLLFAHVLLDEYSRAIHGYRSLIYQYSLKNSQLSPQKLALVKEMTDQEKCDLIFEADRPAYEIGQILDTWDDVGRQWSKEWDWSLHDSLGFWDFRTFFPHFATKEDMAQEASSSDGVLTVRIPFDLANVVQNVVASNAYPFERGLHFISSLLDADCNDTANRLDKSRCVFRKVGPLWVVSYDGVQGLYKDLIGFKYIHALLRHPHTEFSAIELSTLISGGVYSKVNSELGKLLTVQLEDLGLTKTILDDPIILADRKYRQDLKDHIAEKEQLLASDATTNPEFIAIAQSDLKQMKNIDHEITGFFGRHKKKDTTAENARLNVFQRIDMVLKELQKQNKSLERHFQNYLKRGHFPTYAPEKPPHWIL